MPCVINTLQIKGRAFQTMSATPFQSCPSKRRYLKFQLLIFKFFNLYLSNSQSSCFQLPLFTVPYFEHVKFNLSELHCFKIRFSRLQFINFQTSIFKCSNVQHFPLATFQNFNISNTSKSKFQKGSVHRLSNIFKKSDSQIWK